MTLRSCLTAVIAAALLALSASVASAEDCAPVIAAFMNRKVPFTATFITSGALPPCVEKGCPPPPATAEARVRAARARAEYGAAHAGEHLWTGSEWYFWIRGHGWFTLHDRGGEPAKPMPRDLTVTCRAVGEEAVNGEDAILHTLHVKQGLVDDRAWISKATGLLLKSVHRQRGGRLFVSIFNYKDVPVMPPS